MITKQSYRVFNYNYFPLAVKGMNREYLFQGARDGRPSFQTLPFEDIEYINSQSNVFRSGMLCFDEAEADGIQNSLRNYEWQNTTFNADSIVDAILNPTYSKMRRVLEIQDMNTIERFRGQLVKTKTLGTDGVSGYVEYIITERFKELCRNVRVSKIPLREEKFAPTEPQIDQKIVSELQAKNKELEDKLNAILAKVSTTVETAVEDAPDKTENDPVKKTAPKRTAVKKTV